jgi:hypothetical protein
MHGLRCVLLLLVSAIFPALIHAAGPLSAPRLTNNPSLDVIVTTAQPLLSFFCAKGGTPPRKYIIQLDNDPTFAGKARIEYRDVPEESKFVTSFPSRRTTPSMTRFGTIGG